MPHGCAGADAQRMSASSFRAFQDGRPDHERWELIGGVSVLMPPRYRDHDRIASNLEHLLNRGLEGRDTSREAVQRIGIELGVTDIALARLELNQDYRPEPDLMVVDRPHGPDRRRVHSAYLIAEVVSDDDRRRVPSSGRGWLDIKELLYTLHPWCEAVIEIEHERVEVRSLVKDGEWWVHDTMSGMEDVLVLPRFGLRCRLGDLYAGTPLAPPGGVARAPRGS